jgi:coproporphyrinogen III oxidase-like Fe-S oxidoreductase
MGPQPPVHTLYLGGGTPSILGPDRIARLLHSARSVVSLAPDCEVTLEVNPETIDRAGLAACRDAGVNRVSIGVQSFHDAQLQWLGRIHDAERAIETVEDALAAGMRVSIDLIYGLPGQSGDEWAQDLERAAALGVGHISAYELSYEPGTPLHAERPLPGRPQQAKRAKHELGPAAKQVAAFGHRCIPVRGVVGPPSPSTCPGARLRSPCTPTPCGQGVSPPSVRGKLFRGRPLEREELFFVTHKRLGELGFVGYEVSSFARNVEQRSRHNLATWAHEPYIGVGPGAHSYLGSGPGKDAASRRPQRRWNLPDVESWLSALDAGGIPPFGHEPLTPGQVLLERVMLGLRCLEGIDLEACERECGAAATRGLRRRASRLADRGQILLEDSRIVPTLEGMALADRLALELSADED